VVALSDARASSVFVMKAAGTKVEKLTRTESLEYSPDRRQLSSGFGMLRRCCSGRRSSKSSLTRALRRFSEAQGYTLDTSSLSPSAHTALISASLSLKGPQVFPS
jgi:hypothetical protein